MSWLGAGIGAGIGMVVGGPVGAAIGAWLGSSVSGRSARGGAGGIGMHDPQAAQTTFFVALFSMLAKMAKADGKVTSEEADVVNHFAKNMLKMDAEDRKAAKDIFTNALDDQYSIYDYADQYRQIAPNHQMQEMIYRLLFSVAFSDKSLHPAEDEILKQIPARLGLDDSYYRILMDEFHGQSTDLSGSYDILGCTSESTDSEVKKAYRKLCMEYHPDKIGSKGLPDGFMKFAEEQMHQINESYSAIMDSRK
ncbi:MAG: TerB family tellurite resistance protein [Mariprofundaceae bacterium]